MGRASLVLSVLYSVGLLNAQSLNGPVEGFTFDAPTKSFRAVIGSLGAASLGPALLKGLDYGSVAPRQDYALFFQNGRCLAVTGLGSSQISTVPLPGAFPVPEGVVWSGNGSVAILYSQTGNWIQTVRGLPGSAELGPSLSVSQLGGSLSAVATDFNGNRTVIGVAGDAGGVFQIAGDLSFAQLFSLSMPVSLAFSDDGSTLYALDRAAGKVSEMNMADLSLQAWPLKLADPFTVRAARDATQRRVVYAAGRNDRLLVAYDASSHEILAQVALDSQPTDIEPLGRNSFVLGPRASDDEPLWSFTNAAQPIVYFVPATPLTSEDSGR